MPSLFISYRRGDCPDTVKLIYERLKKRLPRWEIFYDHDSVPLGEQFPEQLRAKVTTATAVLVIVGPKWVEILHERKSAPIDHVREEVRLALEAGASVVPVLAGRAVMPTDVDLADFADLHPLLKRNGQPVRPDPDFDSDLEPIVAHLKSLDTAEAVGTILDDKYTLTQYVDEGGMGVVYAAQQKQPVQRMVAIKLIKPGMDSRDVLARFDAERQALAVMDHPNVAKVLDAGMTPHGRPYFVMEYVKGVPITQYCDDKKLNPQERLNLFIPVCNAVQHAHQKGIIHRDLKPSNVLVEVVDGKPVPKVIDFGLAKALGQKLTDKTLHTALEMRVGTLEYSAPEQAAGRSFDVDTRSDIYSLGVLLYELLTGAPPFTREELLKIGEEEMKRVIREDVPTTPSKKLSSSGELPAIAAKRHLEPGKLTRMVQGDLDWIVMKCLEKENARRYETANQLGQELQRFLADEPVQAGPPSAAYRMRKFLRRNKGGVIAASLVFLALIGGLIGMSIGVAIAEHARENEAEQRKLAEFNEIRAKEAAEKARVAEEAERQAKMATLKRLEQIEKAKVLLQSVFDQLEAPSEEKGDIEIRKALRKKLDDIAVTLQNLDADKLARLRYTLGSILSSLGERGRAVGYLTDALNYQVDIIGANSAEALRTRNNLAVVTHYLSPGTDANPSVLESVLQKRKARLGADHRETIVSMNNVAAAYSNAGRSKEALELYELTLKKCRETLPTDDACLFVSATNLSAEYWALGDLEKAVKIRQTIRKPTVDNPHISRLESFPELKRLSLRGISSSEKEQTLQELNELLGACEKKTGAENPMLLLSMRSAPLAYRTTEGMSKPVHVDENALENFGLALSLMKELAMVHLEAKRVAKATPLIEKYLEARRKQTGPNDPRFAAELASVAFELLRRGHDNSAEPILRECAAIRRKSSEGTHETLKTMATLGQLLLRQEKFEEAATLLREVEKLMWKTGFEKEDRREAEAVWVALRTAEDRCRMMKDVQDRMAELRKKHGADDLQFAEVLVHESSKLPLKVAELLLGECLEIRTKRAPNEWSTFDTKLMLAENLLLQKKYAAAEPLLHAGYAGMRQREKSMPPNAKGRLTTALKRLVEFYEAMDNAEIAEIWRKDLAARQEAEKEPKK